MKKIRSRYEIKGQIGAGGMGVVFRGYDPPPMDRVVAIKTLPAMADRLALDLFYKECNTLKSINHPNIVDIFDMGEFEEDSERRPFFVMPLLQGQTLEEILRKEPHKLTVKRVVEIIAQTCRGLQAAHDAGLIHRDIKPSNIFILGDDSVKIIDFGVAQVVDNRSRAGSFTKGTLLYMAPEQTLSKPVTPQSDIFSLAVVCYEALTRRHPFRGASEQEIVDAIRHLNPPPATAINDSVNQLISSVVHKALAKKPLIRYDNAREFGEHLQRAEHNLPIEIFETARIQPRIDRARRAIVGGEFQHAGDIVSELEASGHIDPQIAELRADLERVERQRTIKQGLESAQSHFEEEDDPLALQKLHEVLQFDPGNVPALGLKAKIEERRSERDVERWMRLAEEHIHNHSYSHARDALQNVRAIRPDNSRALRLQKDLEADEQEYLHLRQEKAELYESAVNAWKNGHVSEALSQMRLVLDLDRRAPDISTREGSAPYEAFFNKIRSEHDALNNAYAEAKRKLAEQDYAKALALCEEFLQRYPGQPLFQALKFEIEELQRQQLSAHIAEVNRRLEGSADLDANVSLVREAVARHPGEPYFERLLKSLEDKRNLVRSIVQRSEMHESRQQINEALSDLDTLASIYPAYPGLKYDRERLEKRREQQRRESAKAELMRKVDRERMHGDHARAIELLDKAELEFPNEPSIIHLRQLIQRDSEQAQRAVLKLEEGQRLWAAGDVETALATLREAHELNDREPRARAAFRDILMEHARRQLDANRGDAEKAIDEAFALDAQHPVVKSLRAQILDRKREETVAACAAESRRLQAARELDKAQAELTRVLAIYPGDPSLTAILESVRDELGQSSSKKRLNDLEQLRQLRQRAETAKDSGDLDSVFRETRLVAESNTDVADIGTIAREIERIVDARRGRIPASPKTPATKPVPSRTTPAHSRPSLRDHRWLHVTRTLAARRSVQGAAAALVLLLTVGAVAVYYASRTPPPAAETPIARATVRVQPVPAGAQVLVDGKAVDTSAVLELEPGEHEFQATLLGYTPLTQRVTLNPGTAPDLQLALSPLPLSMRLVTPDMEAGNAWLDDAVANVEGGSLSQEISGAGDHVLRIAGVAGAKEQATIAFTTQLAALPTVTSMQVPQRQTVVVTSLGRSARIQSSLANLPVMVDSQARGTLTPEGLTIDDLEPGVHELAIGEGKTLRRMSFSVGAAPALDAIVYSDRDVGSLLIVTGESDVTIQIDGRDYTRKTANGELRVPNLASRSHTVKVRKDGFSEPTVQTVNVLKGQEAILRFALTALQRPAHLEIQRGQAGLQIFLDDGATAVATVGGNGTLLHEVQPGQRVVRLVMDGYQTKFLTKTFAAGETVTLLPAELQLQPLQATLDVVADGGIDVTVTQNNQAVRRFTGSSKFPLGQGTYVVSGRDAAGSVSSQTVTLAAGESRTVTLSARPLASAMETLERSGKWTRRANWLTRRGGGFALYEDPRPPSRVTFTVRPRRENRVRRIAPGSPRLRWVVGYIDSRNYLLIEMDDKSLYRTEFVDGKKTEWPKIEHKVSWAGDSFNIAIDVADGRVIHQASTGSEPWRAFDTWDHASAGGAGATRNLADGKFGFYLPGNGDEIELANLTFQPRAAR